MLRATKDMAGKKVLSQSLYMFRCYLLCLYKILIVALCSTVVGMNSNFRILSDPQNQTDIFILLIIFGIYVFSNDKDIIEFIHLFLSMQNKQQAQ